MVEAEIRHDRATLTSIMWRVGRMARLRAAAIRPLMSFSKWLQCSKKRLDRLVNHVSIPMNRYSFKIRVWWTKAASAVWPSAISGQRHRLEAINLLSRHSSIILLTPTRKPRVWFKAKRSISSNLREITTLWLNSTLKAISWGSSRSSETWRKSTMGHLWKFRLRRFSPRKLLNKLYRRELRGRNIRLGLPTTLATILNSMTITILVRKLEITSPPLPSSSSTTQPAKIRSAAAFPASRTLLLLQEPSRWKTTVVWTLCSARTLEVYSN